VLQPWKLGAEGTLTALSPLLMCRVSSLNLKLAAAEGTVVQHAKHVTDLQQQMIDMQNRGIEQSRIERSGGGDHHI